MYYHMHYSNTIFNIIYKMGWVYCSRQSSLSLEHHFLLLVAPLQKPLEGAGPAISPRHVEMTPCPSGSGEVRDRPQETLTEHLASSSPICVTLVALLIVSVVVAFDLINTCVLVAFFLPMTSYNSRLRDGEIGSNTSLNGGSNPKLGGFRAGPTQFPIPSHVG